MRIRAPDCFGRPVNERIKFAMREIRIWLRLIGTFAVYRSGQQLQATQVGSRKARVLLALLAVEHGCLVPVDRVAEVLWGDTWPSRPAENAATLVSRVRSTLGPDVVVGGRGGYRLGGSVGVDLWAGGGLIAAAEADLARGEPAPARLAAERATALFGNATVLTDESGALWAEPARAAHQQLLRRTRLALAEAALRMGDVQGAQTAAEAAATADPFDEGAHRALMRAYEAAGEPAWALALYERLRATLSEEFGIDPSSATRSLHLTILRNATVTAAPVGNSTSLAGMCPWP